MWRKSDNEPERTSSNPSPSSPPSRPSARSGGERAIIGPSISIQGDVTGEEDLVVQGRVEGKIDLKQHNVTIGKDGRVKADIFGRLIQVEGEVRGNLFGDEQIVVAGSGQVEGNITAPRVTLEDGCRFKGSIDMEPKGGTRKTGVTSSGSTSSGSTSSSSSSGSGSRSSGSSAGSSKPSETGAGSSGKEG
jgi:cytoskeletal protein CcmA (bactofilin family)